MRQEIYVLKEVVSQAEHGLGRGQGGEIWHWQLHGLHLILFRLLVDGCAL